MLSVAMALRALFLLFLLASAGCRPAGVVDDGSTQSAYQPVEGDFLFQSLPHNPLIDAIEGSTGSPYSHCGIVKKHGDQWVVIEAIGPVKVTTLSWWIAQGRDKGFAAYRLSDPLSTKVPDILRAAERYGGRPYDIHYDMDDEKIYCSELIYKAVRDATGRKLGTLRKLKDLDWQPHEQVIRRIENGKLPLEREMITPVDLSKAPELREVYRSGI